MKRAFAKVEFEFTKAESPDIYSRPVTVKSTAQHSTTPAIATETCSLALAKHTVCITMN
jgi:hypothetical protein